MNGGGRNTFSDFKVMYAAISYKVFQGHGLAVEGWVRVACGQCLPAVCRIIDRLFVHLVGGCLLYTSDAADE